MKQQSFTDIPPLNAKEQLYKSVYLDKPHAHLDKAQTLNEINSSCPELAALTSPADTYSAQDSMNEKYFPQLLDIMIIRHLRYSPAFLHSHSFFEIIYVINGSCRNIFSTKTLDMQAGEICITAPGSVHAVSAFSEDCIIYNLMVRSATFKQTFLNSLPAKGILHSFFSRTLYETGSGAYLYFKNKQDPVLLELAEQMIKEYSEQKNYYDSLLNALLTTFFIQLLRKHEKDVLLSAPENIKQDDNIIFILKYLELHCDTVTLPELAEFFNYSERQLGRLLKEYTGKTFVALIQDSKLSKACDLLKHPDLSISDIVKEVGYSNVTHFYSVFKKHFSMTPAEYRKKSRLNTEFIT